jgi:hypothetical protein
MDCAFERTAIKKIDPFAPFLRMHLPLHFR